MLKARSARRVVLLLLLLLGLPAAGFTATVKVDGRDTASDAGGCGSRSNACGTIQAGIDNANPGDVVSIARGEYPELVVVGTANLTLKGQGTLTQPPPPVAECVGDPARTVFTSCFDLETGPECDAAWTITAEGAGDVGRITPPHYASCFWDDINCRPCSPGGVVEGACVNTCEPLPAASMLVTAPGVRIEKLRFQAIGDGPLAGAGRAGIVVTEAGGGATIQKVRMDAVAGDCIVSFASRTTVTSNTLRGCGGQCIEVRGDLATITRNRVRQCDSNGVSALGQDILVSRNSVLLTDSTAIRFGGEDIVLERNRMSGSEGKLLEGAGASFAVLRNKARLAQDEGFDLDCEAVPSDCSADPLRTTFAGWDGFGCRSAADELSCNATWTFGPSFRATSCFWDATVPRCLSCTSDNENDGDCVNACRGGSERCTEASVERNRIEDVLEEACMKLSSGGAGLAVERNKVALCTEEGIDLRGAEVVLRGNQVSDCGSRVRSHHGVEISGTGHVLEGNTAQRCAGDGFVVGSNAVDVTLTGNRAIDNGGDGFDVRSAATGTAIDGALASANTGNGIEVSAGAVGTSVTGSRASGHLLDFCDEGTGTVATGNRFGTSGSLCTDP